MILKQYYLGCLARASYLLGDEASRTAIIVDPQRDIQQYVADAEILGLQIRHVFLTHFHADFVAGYLELRDRCGASIHLGSRAQPEYTFVPMHDGDTLEFPGLRLEVLETPGHTIESISMGMTALAFWKLLYEYRADLVLNGHDHLYARYRPLDPSGNYDPNKGIREFIVGTGGETLDTVVYTTTLPNTDGADAADAADLSGQANFNLKNIEAATGEFWGVMGLTLHPNGYAWDFESALKDPAQTTGPASFSDKGVGTCHGPVVNQVGFCCLDLALRGNPFRSEGVPD